MSIARRLGLDELPGYTPGAFVVTAFAAGVQAAIVVQAFGGAGYPPEGKATLTWATLAILGVSALLNVPLSSAGFDTARIRQALSNLGGRRAVILEPYFTSDGSTSSTEQTNGSAQPEPEQVLPTLSARVHSPLSAGPVVAPGEAVPITVEAEPLELAEDLTVTFEIHGPGGSRQVQRAMDGTQLTHEVSFHQAGSFEIHVRLEHPKADPVSRRLSGQVASYREEVGRRFEELKERMAAMDLNVGPQSTPREVCAELDRVDAAEPDRLADLAVELEVALYGDQEVDRSTYETVYTSLQALRLDPQEVPG